MSRRPEDEPDIQIGAAARAKKLRFNKKPEAEVEFEKHGEANLDDVVPEELEIQTASGSERKNLPDEVEPGVTYRDVEVRWGAAARIVPPEPEEEEDD